MSHCNWLLRIPSREEHGSMNLGQAVAICLYELKREGAVAELRYAKPGVAEAGDLERITALLREVLQHSGYVNDRTSGSTELKIRRMVRRLRAPKVDVETWLGILRQILWKVRGG